MILYLSTLAVALLGLAYALGFAYYTLVPQRDAPRKPYEKKRVAIVGAGFSGLITCKELLEFGHDVMLFERSDRIGGVFAHFYQSGQLTSSSAITPFGCFPADNLEKPQIWTFKEYCAYLSRMCDKFKLWPAIKFHSNVKSIRRLAANRWQVVVERTPEGGSGAPVEETHEFHHVVIATGIAQSPNVPELPTQEKFAGKILHSNDYLAAEPFRGKRVLLVGLGESGSDITLEVAKVAEASAVTSRIGPGYIIPRWLCGAPTDIDNCRGYRSVPRRHLLSWPLQLKRWLENYWLLPEDDRKILATMNDFNRKTGMKALRRFRVKNTSFIHAMLYEGLEYHPWIARLEADKAVFEDGSEFACDTILCCTGYKSRFPYLQATHPRLAEAGTNVRNFFKHCYDVEFGTEIAWIGYSRPANGSIPPLSEMAARYFALLVSGQLSLPSRAAMERHIREDNERDYAYLPRDAKKIPALVNFLAQLDSFATLMGVTPPYLRLFFTRPLVWFRVLFGPLNGIHYRLAGPNRYPVDHCSRVILKIPTMPFVVLVLEAVTLFYARAYDWVFPEAPMPPKKKTMMMEEEKDGKKM